MLLNANNTPVTQSPFPTTFENLIEQLGSKAEFARTIVQDAIAFLSRDSDTGMRSFTTRSLFDPFWADPHSVLFNTLYGLAESEVGNEEDIDSICQRVFHLYGLLVYDQIMNTTEIWVCNDNFDREKNGYYEPTDFQYTEQPNG